jgi:putative ATP-dependent endonuclease of OLD family
MKVTKLEIENFRLLKHVELSLEEDATVIVGRNNSGKTSLTEIFRRLLSEKSQSKSPSFTLYDFSITAIEGFKQALDLKLQGAEQDVIRKKLPTINLKFTISYEPEVPDLGVLGDFIIDLNPDCHEVVIIVKYQLQDGKINNLFEGVEDESPEATGALLKVLKEKIPLLYETRVFAQDSNDEENIAVIEYTKFKQLIGAGFINAQRGLDDITHTEKDVLGRILAKLFKTANAQSAPEDLKEKSEALQNVIKDIQQKVDEDFNQKLDGLLPALKIFGYPGLADPNLSTETTLDINNILDSQTKIRYSQGNGLFLPETYNGLGSRNLIYILFQLFEFFRDWQSRPVTTGLYVVFIEEPEAHLHPQMQQVFIKQINAIAAEFSQLLNANIPWPVQFVVTTHSTHIANEAKFEAIRYFLTTRNQQKETIIKDLRAEFNDQSLNKDKEFLHKYLTLTKCDLYFADKAILIEGSTERILMPLIIEKVDALENEEPKLLSQYITVIEVGGAYAHHFSRFLDFLQLRSLVVTDLDAVLLTQGERITYPASEVALGTHSSNAAIKNWFAKDTEGFIPLPSCKDRTAEEKVEGCRRIAYQIPEPGKTCCGRSFEDAFILANPALFGLSGKQEEEMAALAYKMVPKRYQKTNFALKYALEQLDWNPPFYLVEGLQWLAKNPNVPSTEVEKVMVNVIEETI